MNEIIEATRENNDCRDKKTKIGWRRSTDRRGYGSGVNLGSRMMMSFCYTRSSTLLFWHAAIVSRPREAIA